MTRARRHVFCWIAALALLLASLAPTLSHAFGLQGPTSWTEICTSAGARRVPLDDGQRTPKSPATAGLLDHCPCCSLHLDNALPPPPVLALPEPLPLGRCMPLAWLHADRTLSVWSSAQARAPPLRT